MASCHDGNIVTFVYIMKCWIGWILVGLLIFGGCRPIAQAEMPNRWQTYRNPRFDFEFPYPEGWVESAPPENRDGVTFSDPKNPQVTIRAWAESLRSLQKSQPKPEPNFKTEQGVSGRLEVKIESQSSFTVTFHQNNVEYNWQGTAPNQQFSDYYRFFSYVASRFRIPNKSE